MLFYEQLIRISPTLGTQTGYAAAVAEAKGPEAGLAVLDGIDPAAVSTYQPYWAVRAHLLQRLGKTPEAVDASTGRLAWPRIPPLGSSYSKDGADFFLRALSK
ncbi:MAG: hypothetical protein WCA20_32390 [Candidatus Sulfotelmatobacter sp.]